VQKPWDQEEMQIVISEGLRSYNQTKKLAEQEDVLHKIQSDNLLTQREVMSPDVFDEIIGSSAALKYVLYKVKQIAPSDTAVLIHGETGSGKELFARAIHQASPRKGRMLMNMNCSVLRTDFIEGELFGVEKKEKTGAQSIKIGRIELADRSTIFIDEIAEIPLRLQSKLLRVIAHGEFKRVRSADVNNVDVRVIAATNRDIEKEVAEGRFNKKLYSALNEFPITIPPLRYRKEDIPEIAHVLLEKYNKKMGKKINNIHPDMMQSLREYSWPGNIRELENTIERAVITAQGSSLQLYTKLGSSIEAGEDAKKLESLAEVEKKYIQQVLEMTGWKIRGENGAAIILDLKPTTLEARIKRLGIQRNRS
jgi:transcriptional regulator with GAF, ATPase, and Fis domain